MANQENDKTFFGNAAMHKGKFGEFFRLGWNEDDLKTMLEIARGNDGWCNAFLKEGKSGKWYMEAADSGRDNDRSDRGRDNDRGRDRDDSRGRDDRDRDERPSSRFGRSRDDRDEPRDSGADRSRGTGRFGNKAY